MARPPAKARARPGPRPKAGEIASFLAITVAFFVVYAASDPEHLLAQSGGRHFVYLAESFLRGHFDLVSRPPSYHDMTNFAGQWYVTFPPLPAVVLMPFVALWGLAVPEILISVVLGAINCGLVWLLLGRVPVALPAWARLGLTALFGLGTVHWYSALAGSVWFFAHIVAVTFATLYAIEVLGKNRPVVAAVFLGLAGLARTPAFFGFPLFVTVALAARAGKAKAGAGRTSAVVSVLTFGAVLGLFVVAMLAYNYVRFGSPLEFGYTQMQIANTLAPRLREHGQFSLAFLPENLYYFLIAPPIVPGPVFVVEPNQWGLGLIFASPGLLYAFRGLRRNAISVGAALAALLVAIPNLLYYNTGWVQFGYRFSLDFLPFVMVLAAFGTRGRIGRLGLVAIALSIVAEFWGYHWFLKIPILGMQIWSGQ
jgi:hypothetical protein